MGSAYRTPLVVLFFALVSDEIQAVVDFYPSREEAEAELREALSDEPEWADVLRVETLEFETSPN